MSEVKLSFTAEERKNIKQKYARLLNTCKHLLDKKDIQQIRKALDHLIEYHKDTRRKSGEPYIYHPIDVAQIAAGDLGLGPISIISALLHDISDGEDFSESKFQKNFGKEITDIIKGLNKISGLYTSKISLNSQNFIKLLLAISNDVRIILLKLADRLHNMRSMEKMPYEKQQKISQETKLLYSPIAHRLGLYNIKSELEELSMKYLENDIYSGIAKKLNDSKSNREIFIKKFSAPIEKELGKLNIEYSIKGRPKSISSIWNKMRTKKVDFEEVFDLFAIRIILKGNLPDEKFACWNIYSIVSNIYNPDPLRLRDWITTPKDSGYESLHTTVLGPDNKWVEVQIRTERMDEIAEKGNAAHWKYKEAGASDNTDAWLANIRNLLENPRERSFENTDSAKVELYKEDIFIFTPTGDIKKLRTGATVLDFAFAVHTNVGSTCTSAKINNKIVPIKHELKNGDTVEIVTAKNQKPKQDWLNIVKSPRAKQKIKRLLKEEEYKQSQIGKEIFLRKMNQLKIGINDELMFSLLTQFKFKNNHQFYQSIATEKIDIAQIKDFIIELNSPEKQILEKRENEKIEGFTHTKVELKKDFLLLDKTLENIDFKLAKCCNPIYGDKIFGFVTVSAGTKVHRNNCPNAKQMKERYPYRIIDARWAHTNSKTAFLTVLEVTGIDKMGIVNNISKVISSDLQVDMRSITIETEEGIFNGRISVYVNNVEHLAVLTKNLLKIKGILKVNRLNS
jgi:GTP diphosphokinase / guanosine-3',5'-bis(diphosphate) 3'-diphosphatase